MPSAANTRRRNRSTNSYQDWGFHIECPGFLSSFLCEISEDVFCDDAEFFFAEVIHGGHGRVVGSFFSGCHGPCDDPVRVAGVEGGDFAQRRADEAGVRGVAGGAACEELLGGLLGFFGGRVGLIPCEKGTLVFFAACFDLLLVGGEGGFAVGMATAAHAEDDNGKEEYDPYITVVELVIRGFGFSQQDDQQDEAECGGGQDDFVKQGCDADARKREEQQWPGDELRTGGPCGDAIEQAPQLLAGHTVVEVLDDVFLPEPTGSRKAGEGDGCEHEMQIARKDVADFQGGEKSFHLFPLARKEHEVDVGKEDKGDGEKHQGGGDDDGPVEFFRVAASPAMPCVFVQVGEQKSGGNQWNDEQPCVACESVRAVPLHGINEVDAQQRAYAHDHGEAFVHGDRFRQFEREGIVFFAFESQKLKHGHQQRAADGEVHEEDVDEKKQDEQSLEQAFRQGQRKRKIAGNGDFGEKEERIHGCDAVGSDSGRRMPEDWAPERGREVLRRSRM